MEYLALYRKYRPTSFSNLIGQEHIVKTLTNQIESGRLGHAYLFTGTRGTGKTTVAKIFAKAINCQSPVDGSPCGKCESCLALADPSNIDVLEIDAASNNGVNEIRDLRENVQYPPVSCKYKVYIIDEVHMLTGPAFNALLKTLEEPPKHAVFILATTEVHKIPATILSRCMRFDFRLVATEEIADLISSIYDEQNKEYDREAVFAIAKAGEGSVRDALSIADTALSYSNGKLTYDDVMAIMGSSNKQVILDFIDNLIMGNSGKVLDIIDNMVKLGKGMGILVKDITSAIRDMLIVKTCDDANKILSLPIDKFETLEKITQKVSEDRLVRIMEIFADCESNLKYSTNPRVIFETASIKATRPDSDYNVDALLARISDLELKIQNGIKIESSAVATQSTQIVKPQVEQKKTLKDLSSAEISAKILGYLRKNSAEMLFNIIQNVDVKVMGNSISITTDDLGDKELIEKPSNLELIKNSLSGFGEISIEVKATDKEKRKEQIDIETEKMKKVFGDDIVILKD